jgi:hypothetical protein
MYLGEWPPPYMPFDTLTTIIRVGLAPSASPVRRHVIITTQAVNFAVSIVTMQQCCCSAALATQPGCCFALARVSMASTLCCLPPCPSAAPAATVTRRFAHLVGFAAAAPLPLLLLLALPLPATSVSRAPPSPSSAAAAVAGCAGAPAVTMGLACRRFLVRGSCRYVG